MVHARIASLHVLRRRRLGQGAEGRSCSSARWASSLRWRGGGGAEGGRSCSLLLLALLLLLLCCVRLLSRLLMRRAKKLFFSLCVCDSGHPGRRDCNIGAARRAPDAANWFQSGFPRPASRRTALRGGCKGACSRAVCGLGGEGEQHRTCCASLRAGREPVRPRTTFAGL